ncbi:MAG: transcriptional repressor [Olsenella uli]|uniref:Fur family transcriptional regulator n=1 Tax=Olsenella uli TaxID=133926 RepID=UPI001D9199F1|nr:transcriptional repressor [Olsenella uli]MBS6418916.1 transcriptional repressor [Olsenella uli]
MADRRNTRQRQLVLDAVRSRCDHPTADQVYQVVRAQDCHVSRATVYRNLHLLADAGDILSIKVPGGERFDLRADAHPHIICSSCGRVADVPFERGGAYEDTLDERASLATSWQVSTHSLVFTGLCPHCVAEMRRQQLSQPQARQPQLSRR